MKYRTFIYVHAEYQIRVSNLPVDVQEVVVAAWYKADINLESPRGLSEKDWPGKKRRMLV